jgi:hypothetical protein
MRGLAESTALLHEHGIDDFGGCDQQRQTAGGDANEGRLPPTMGGMGKEGEDAKDKAEQRRRRAGDYAERRGHGEDGPGTCDNRENRTQPDGRAVTRAHANSIPELRKWTRPALVTFPCAGPGEG